jgi:hypothetical protein
MAVVWTIQSLDDLMPLLIDDEDLVVDDGQLSINRSLRLDAAEETDHFEKLLAQEGFAFGSALSPQQVLWAWEEHCANLAQEDLGLSWVVHPQIASVIYRGRTGYSWLVPQCLPLGILKDLECPECRACFWGPGVLLVWCFSLHDWQGLVHVSHIAISRSASNAASEE